MQHSHCTLTGPLAAAVCRVAAMMGWAAAGAHSAAKGSQLSQLLSLSGSFAASGLVAAAACYSSPAAHAWTMPLTARLSDPGLPPRVEPRPIRGSGKLVQRLNSWDTVVVRALAGRCTAFVACGSGTGTVAFLALLLIRGS